MHEKPCPKCGHCPTCGRSNATPYGGGQPWPWPRYPYGTNPYGTNPYPYPYATWSGLGASGTTANASWGVSSIADSGVSYA